MKIYLCQKGFRFITEILQGLLPDDEILDCLPEEIATKATDANVLIPTIIPLGKAELSLPNLRLVQQFGAGLDTVDISSATTNGVYVANVPAAGTGNAESVAEVAVMHMLNLSRRYAAACQSIQDRKVSTPTSWSLKGRTALIVGYGGIGLEVARRLSGFEMKIQAVSRSGPKHTAEEQSVAVDVHTTTDQLHTLLPEADFVVLAPPLNDETRGLMGSEEFALMKASAFVINVARGGVIDYEALLAALRDKQIMGAGLDVFEEEPCDPNDPLFGYNVTATPHIGGATDLSFQGIAKKVAENIQRVGRGEVPLNCVNGETVKGR
ncbi:MAG: hydroxyacid dehydrogenase [Gammaproteobacteria bacterium]|nr:MAG: hydroxyacid dehydrogenase [Gammaproteobacteria bacterium]